MLMKCVFLCGWLLIRRVVCLLTWAVRPTVMFCVGLNILTQYRLHSDPVCCLFVFLGACSNQLSAIPPALAKASKLKVSSSRA